MTNQHTKHISMNDVMIQAILAGRKTQTRRPLTVPDDMPDGYHFGYCGLTLPRHIEARCKKPVGLTRVFNIPLKYCTGDTLWVKTGGITRVTSGITLEVTGITIEKLHDISDEDCWAEGVCHVAEDIDSMAWGNPDQKMRRDITLCHFGGPKYAFHYLWDSCYIGANHWNNNPWVQVVHFKTHLININEFLQQRAA